MHQYYSLPIDFKRLVSGKKPFCCDQEKAVRQFIDLIVLTGFGEYQREEAFGCEIWDKEYEIIPRDSKWQAMIQRSIKTSVRLYEKRLENVSIQVKADENRQLMKRVEITVQGTICLTGEAFQHQKVIYLCPRSME